jgi:hypothetical protein
MVFTPRANKACDQPAQSLRDVEAGIRLVLAL